MTIDEAIAQEREIAKEQKTKYDKCPTRMRYCCEMCFHNPKCNEVAEQCEQIAEWLEELKDLREMKETIECNAEVLEQQGYNNAIDDFQEWLKTQIVGIDNKTKEILVVVDDRWELATDRFKESD